MRNCLYGLIFQKDHNCNFITKLTQNKTCMFYFGPGLVRNCLYYIYMKNQIPLRNGEDHMIFLVCIMIIVSIHVTLILKTDFEWAMQLSLLANIVIYYIMLSIITNDKSSNNIYNSFIFASAYAGGAILGSFIFRAISKILD
jgi:hypothetical protein